MNYKTFFLTTMSVIVLLVLAACGSSNTETVSTNDETESNSVSAEDESKEQTDAKKEETDNAADKYNDEKQTSAAEDVQISSGEEAVQFLKQQLEEGKDEDVSFGTDGKILEEDNASYYMVQLVDVSVRASGKTGNLGYYKVYQNGTYEVLQASSSDNNNVSGKEAYLAKLNAMEEADKNAEAKTTTEEMLEQEEEMLEQEEERFKKWDDELNTIYGLLTEQLPDDQMESLREEQRNWIEERDEEAKASSLEYEGGTMESLEYTAVRAKLTRERCYELVARYME